MSAIYKSRKLLVRKSVLIEHKRFIYSCENPTTDNYFHDKMMSFHKKLLRIAAIPSYNRIGVRAYVKIGYMTIEDFIMRSKSQMFFSNKFIDCIKQDLDFTDLYLTLQNENSRLNLGPMKKDEENNYTKEFVVNDNMKDDYILLDIDCFQSNVKSNDLRGQYKKIYDRIYAIRNRMIGFFEGECDE